MKKEAHSCLSRYLCYPRVTPFMQPWFTLFMQPWVKIHDLRCKTYMAHSHLSIPPATTVSGLHSCSGFPSVSCWISSELNTQSEHDMLFFIRCLSSLSLIIFIAICSIILYTICTQELFILRHNSPSLAGHLLSLLVPAFLFEMTYSHQPFSTTWISFLLVAWLENFSLSAYWVVSNWFIY